MNEAFLQFSYFCGALIGQEALIKERHIHTYMYSLAKNNAFPFPSIILSAKQNNLRFTEQFFL